MDKIIAYVYDFLSMTLEEEGIKDEIKQIVIYGSAAKGTYDKESDIDLFFDIKSKEKTELIENFLRKAIRSFEIKSEKTWKLKKINFPISFIVGSLEDETWKGIREEISSSGILLYGPYKEIPNNLQHFHLFYYSLANLSRKDKMKFIRSTFGYRLKKSKKEYKQKGFIEEVGGIKLASNVVLVPSIDSLKIKNIFYKHKIKYQISEVWIRI
jgi:predicted nucleotidyltransferase